MYDVNRGKGQSIIECSKEARMTERGRKFHNNGRKFKAWMSTTNTHVTLEGGGLRTLLSICPGQSFTSKCIPPQ